MSCLSATLIPIISDVTVDTWPIQQEIVAAFSPVINDVTADTRCIRQEIVADVSRVCSTNSELKRYLKVTEGVFWLDVSNDFSMDVEVVSNVTWRIE